MTKPTLGLSLHVSMPVWVHVGFWAAAGEASAINSSKRIDVLRRMITHSPLTRRLAGSASRYLLHRRRFPRSVEDRRVVLVWPIQPQHQLKLARRSRQPIGFFVRTG